jgi:hypothetical protein
MSVFPSRSGQQLAQGDARNNFIRVFTGEVISQFEARTVMLGLHKVRTIPHGRSAKFPVFGQLGAQYHAVGTQLTGSSGNSKLQSAERNIEVDNLLEAHVYIADYDEAMQDMELRGMYSSEMSKALARNFDQRVIRTAINCGREPSIFGAQINPATGLPYFGGGVFLPDGTANTVTRGLATLSAANFNSNAVAFQTAILDAARILDDKFVDDNDRYVLVRPDAYWLLIKDYKNNLDKDWGGSGSLAKGDIQMLGNIKIVKSTNMPVYDSALWNFAASHPTEGTSGTSGTANLRTPVSGESGAVSAYTGDFRKVRALVFTPDAVGTTKLRDLRTESQRFADKKADFLGVDYLMGHGFLRPECVVEITGT